MPHHSSKPWAVGILSSVLPRCHLPNIPVAYPAIGEQSPIVYSHGQSP